MGDPAITSETLATRCIFCLLIRMNRKTGLNSIYYLNILYLVCFSVPFGDGGNPSPSGEELEHELEIITGKVSSDHVHMFISYRPTQNVSKIMQWFRGISSRILLSEYPHLRKQFWGRHLWARGYLAVSSGNITDEMIQQYIEEQEGEPVTDDSRFQIDPS